MTGLNHQTAPVQVREALAVQEQRLPAALDALCQTPGVDEGVLLSTCNRVEVYACSSEGLEDEALNGFLAQLHGVWPETFVPHLYRHRGRGAVTHLFRVASGLDSMVLGEAQIAGQVRAAYEAATRQAAAGRVLHRLFQRALGVAKRIRTTTGIGAGRASVGSVAVELAERIFESLPGHTVLVIGAGEMGASVVQSLRAAGANTTLVANRTFARAQELAQVWGGSAIRFEELDAGMARADIVISSTDAPHPVLTRERVAAAVARRRGKPVFLIDIAVPRDIEPAVDDLAGCYLYNIDDLQAVVADTQASREREVAGCLAVVDEECDQFMHWLGRLALVPTISELSERLHDLKQMELTALRSRLPDMSDRADAEIERMANRLVKKILHEPLRALRAASTEDHPEGLLTAALRLFGLHRGTHGREDPDLAVREAEP
ncbi:glutamyl-tRNA reductase [bacterium]|nr:glutamyl-tRNA reductase [bacterium]